MPTDSSLCRGTERLTRVTRWLPICPMACHPAFWKALDASLREMLARRDPSLDRDANFRLLSMSVAGNSLLIFRPKPCANGFLDVGECLLFVLPLIHRSWQGRSFDNDPAIFRRVERHMKNQGPILAIAARCYNVGCYYDDHRHAAGSAFCRWSEESGAMISSPNFSILTVAAGPEPEVIPWRAADLSESWKRQSFALLTTKTKRGFSVEGSPPKL